MIDVRVIFGILQQLDTISAVALSVVPVLFSIVVHEVSHGWMAWKLGDNTAYERGRLTLNPLPHVDPIGTVLVPLLLLILPGRFLFGWAKPVPFNPYNFYQHVNMRKGTMYVALAGPLSNFILAFIASFFFVASLKLTGNIYIAYFFGIAVFMNVLLGFFNLIPIPPLDGSKILMGLLPPSYDRIFMNIERYGFFILIFLMITGILRILLFPVFSIVNLFLFIPNMIF